MSYILDALKRADRERNRGAVPDIHAQADARPVLTAQPTSGPRPWIWIGLGALLSVAAVMLWQALQPPPTGPSTALTAANTTVTPAPASWPVAKPVAAPVVAPVATPVLPPVTPPTAPVKTAPFLPPPLLPASTAVQAPGQDSQPATVVPKPMALQAAPEDVRRQLTALKLAGGVHSQRAADRLLIVDGQVVREGDGVAAGVVLEQIQPRSAIFRVREQRFEVPF